MKQKSTACPCKKILIDPTKTKSFKGIISLRECPECKNPMILTPKGFEIPDNYRKEYGIPSLNKHKTNKTRRRASTRKKLDPKSGK